MYQLYATGTFPFFWTNALFVPFIALFIITDSYVGFEPLVLIQAMILLSSNPSSNST